MMISKHQIRSITAILIIGFLIRGLYFIAKTKGDITTLHGLNLLNAMITMGLVIIVGILIPLEITEFFIILLQGIWKWYTELPEGKGTTKKFGVKI